MHKLLKHIGIKTTAKQRVYRHTGQRKLLSTIVVAIPDILPRIALSVDCVLDQVEAFALLEWRYL